MKDTKLQFPIITVTTDGFANVVQNKERLQSCTLKALKSKYFDCLKIYDASGYQFDVVNVTKIRTIWSFPQILFLNPFINIDLQLSNNVKKYDIDELKFILLKNIEEENSYWKNIGVYERVKRKLEKAITFNDLYESYKSK
jgi:hypothetical protein